MEARDTGIDDLLDVPLPAVLQINSEKGASGHYWVLEGKVKNGFDLFDPQDNRRFRQTPEELTTQWDGAVLVKKTKGRVLPGVAYNEKDAARVYGGCCGIARPGGPVGCPTCCSTIGDR